MCTVVPSVLLVLFIVTMFSIAAYFIFGYLSHCRKRCDYSETAENKINYSNNGSYKFKVDFNDD